MSFLRRIGTRLRKAKDDNVYNKYKNFVNSSADFSLLEESEFAQTFRQLSDNNELPGSTKVSDVIALADEALNRVSGKRFFETQKVSALLLKEGMLLEMATGEGKTLAFALSAILLSSSNERVTICTANDFLAERDCRATKSLFALLGLESAHIGGTSTKNERIQSYGSQILYTTIREVAYDYLRDGRSSTADELFLPTKGFLLIDEADNALVDNAASPYYLSKDIETDPRLISAAHDFASQSKASKGDEENYKLDDDGKSIELSEKGLEALESFLKKYDFISDGAPLYTQDNLHLINIFQSAGTAIHIMNNGVDYVLQDDTIQVVDKNSGRILTGVTLNDGLQQLIEYKHGLALSKESISTDNVVTESIVKMFYNFAGMSGTLKIDEDELSSVYGKLCIGIPRVKPLARVDQDDVMFMSSVEKTRYALEMTVSAYNSGRPVLLAATNEIEAIGLKSALDKAQVPSQVITSESLMTEASMIAMAGTPYRVTITTASSGRGTDIILGGNLDHFIDNGIIEPKKIDAAREQQKNARHKVISEGGLLVIGFGRQSIKKLDQQLRGRSGRQGDVGETIFIMSLDDKALGEHGAKLRGMLSRMNVKETDMLSHSMITKAFDNSQRSVRESILKSRKFHVQQAAMLESQRKIIYDMRISILTNNDWRNVLVEKYGFEIRQKLTISEVLNVVDSYIDNYNDSLSDLKRSIGFQSYANKSPIQELKNKAFIEYKKLMIGINNELKTFH